MNPSTLEKQALGNGEILDALPYTSGRWIEAISHLNPRFGGMSTVVPQLGTHLALGENFGVTIAAFSETDESGAIKQRPELAATHWSAKRGVWLRDSSIRRSFEKLIKTAHGIHIHGLWEAHTDVSARTARSLRTPYIISAHGMLEPWALAHKGFKKRIYSALIERRNLNGAACLHALTTAEAEDYRRFGIRKPIAIIPNGTDIPRSVDGALFANQFPAVRGKRVVLFLGRLHFKKGLDILVDAWSYLAAHFPDTVLVLAGPDEENSRAKIEALIQDRGIDNRVVFTGMLERDMKWSALATAHCFVLPSHSEGFSIAILEAMGMGLPVIISEQCHLPEVRQAAAGWEIQPNCASLRAALEELLQQPASTSAEIGNRGRRLVHARFDWPAVASQMAELYRWVQGGPRPEKFELQEVRS
jgi:glycosyltransferase involved in cell wall biosynthesis